MEPTQVMAQVMGNRQFRNRVRAIAVIKAHGILGQATPDASELAWARLVVAPDYDAWTEALLMLVQASPATPEAAYSASDGQYATILNQVLPEVIKAKEL